jgi:hypothetical protein
MTAGSLPFYLRPFGQPDHEQDYRLLDLLSNYQAPQDPAGNREWLANRRAYDQQGGKRRHYIAVHAPTSESIAYAALEQQGPDPAAFRIYLVFDPQRWSFNQLGGFLYQQLLADAHTFEATKLVCIEYANDAAFVAFLEAHGFSRMGVAMYNGFEIVRYEQLLTTV